MYYSQNISLFSLAFLSEKINYVEVENLRTVYPKPGILVYHVHIMHRWCMVGPLFDMNSTRGGSIIISFRCSSRSKKGRSY